jgi:hypothetical protein
MHQSGIVLLLPHGYDGAGKNFYIIGYKKVKNNTLDVPKSLKQSY